MSRQQRLKGIHAALGTKPAAIDDLAVAKALATDKIDRAAGAARGRFITVAPGQDAVYLAKQAEAAAWQAEVAANAAPDPADYPMLKDRAERLDPLAPDYQAVADLWNALAAQWLLASAAIENIKEGGKEAVAAATTPAEIQTILDGLDWPSPQQGA